MTNKELDEAILLLIEESDQSDYREYKKAYRLGIAALKTMQWMYQSDKKAKGFTFKCIEGVFEEFQKEGV